MKQPLLENEENEEEDTEECSDSSSSEENVSINNEVMSDSYIAHSFRRRSLPPRPKDKYFLVYIVFYLLGMTTLLPWNFFITAEEYWKYKFRNLTGNDSEILTPRQLQFQPDLAVCSAIPSTIFLILNAFLSNKISLSLRMAGSLIVMLILFVITLAFVKIDTDNFQDIFFYITLSTVFIINIFSAIMSGSLFGVSGQFNSEYITAVVSGQALGGIFSALAEIISLTFAADPSKSAFLYFLVGTVMLILSIVCWFIMSNSKYFKFHVSHQSKQKLGVSSVNADIPDTEGSPTHSAAIDRNYLEPKFSVVFYKIWHYGVSEWLVFVTTLSVYPAITILIESTGKGNKHPWNDIYFLPVVNYLLFNSGDYLGRILAGLLKWPKNNPTIIFVLTLIRIGLVPLFLLCNIVQNHPLPVLIHNDYVFIVMMAIFAVSNGYIANTCLMCAPKLVHSEEKEMASSIMAAFMGVGLTCGSAISFALIQLAS